MKTVIRTLTFAIVAIAMMASCASPKKVAYFQDVANKDTVLQTAIAQALRIQKGDKLMIAVHSRDMQLATLYNMTVPGTRGTSNTVRSLSYTVDSNGQIDFPVLGKITVEGMKRDEVAEYVQNRLINENLCKDAVVIVELDNSYVNVLGEVSRPGEVTFSQDKISIPQALGLAGDMTLYGRRDSVFIYRDNNGNRETYVVNMLDGKSMAQSPVYYLQQNDIIYVQPNDYRKRQSTVNGNNLQSTSFWLSFTSVLTTVAVFLFK